MEPMDPDDGDEHDHHMDRRNHLRNANRWVQPEDPVLKINACTELVFPSHGWLFWDLQFFCEHYISMMPERSRKNVYPRDIIKAIKVCAIKANLQNHLHLKGKVER